MTDAAPVPSGVDDVLIFGHRGASADHVEHSRSAYLAAIEQGADGIETDVRLTGDGVVVCWHDATTDRVTRVAGSVHSLTVDEMRARMPGGSAELVTLDELLALLLAADRPMRLALEIKQPGPAGDALDEAVLAALARVGWDPATGLLRGAAHAVRVDIMCFWPPTIASLAPRVGPGIAMMLLDLTFGGGGEIVRGVPMGEPSLRATAEWLEQETAGRLAGDAAFDAVLEAATIRSRLMSDPSIALGPGVGMVRANASLARSWSRERVIRVWTVNDVEDVRFCLDQGIRQLTSDRPGALRAELAEAATPDQSACRDGSSESGSDRLVTPVGAFVTVDGRRLWVAGHAMATAMLATERVPGVVFLPGAGEIGLDLWDARLAVGAGRSVIYDRAGTGFSDDVELPRSAREVAEELRDLLDTVGFTEPVILVGHSLGGAFALRFAQLFPECVAGLVLLDPVHGGWNDVMPPEMRITEGATSRVVILDEYRETARRWRAEMTEHLPPEIRDAVRSCHEVRGLEAGMREGADFVGVLRELGNGPIPSPAIVLHATAIDPGQAAFTPRESLQASIDALAGLYRSSLTAPSDYRAIPTATHSTLPLLFAADIAAAVDAVTAMLAR